MKVLWIMNVLLPDAEAKINGNGEIVASGGWLYAMAKSIMKYGENIELYTVAASHDVKELLEMQVGNVTHFVIPKVGNDYKYERKYEKHWRAIINRTNPDIIHIHGTECSISMPCIKLYPHRNYVVSLQGLVTEIAKHYYDGLDNKTILKSITLRDIIKTNIFQDKNQFIKRSHNEEIIISSIKHIIGRTTWDHAVASAINPNIIYHKGNESLREEFYTGKWSYANCHKHTVFLSQIGLPYKGFHQLLKAVPIVKHYFPDLQIRIAGDDVTKSNGDWMYRLKINNYGKIIRTMIKEYDLINQITFLGNMNAKGMKEEFLRANLFVSCSSIENSPNSLGEAQILGVPCVASYVGGVPDMIPNDNCGIMYRFEDYQKLAFHIIEVFRTSDTFDNTIMRNTARKMHDCESNVKDLINTYNKILAPKN